MDGKLKFCLWLFLSWLAVFVAAVQFASIYAKPDVVGAPWKIGFALMLAIMHGYFAYDSTRKDRT